MNNGRLFEIVYLLLERGELTAAWLAEHLEVSKRTIYRDIDALSAAGVPVYARQGQGGGIRLMEQFLMDRQFLSHEEQELLMSALQSLHSVGAVEEAHLLSKLSALFQRKPVDWLDVRLESWGGQAREQELFAVCKQAVWDRRVLEIEYDNSQGEHSSRIVEPLRLCFQGGTWYLAAWCRTRRAQRLFRLNRIRSCRVLEEHFPAREYERQDAESRSGAKKPDPEMISLTLQFTAKAAFRVWDSFIPEEIKPGTDGGFLVHTAFPPGRWVTGFLLSFGSEVRILEPQWLREQICREAKEMQALYET